MDPVTASILVVIAVLTVETIVALVWFIRDQRRGVEVVRAQVAVSKQTIAMRENVFVEYSWELRNRNIGRGHYINVDEKLEIQEHPTATNHKNLRSAGSGGYWSGRITRVVSWAEPGQKDLSGELTVTLPDGRSFTASGSGVVYVGGGA